MQSSMLSRIAERLPSMFEPETVAVAGASNNAQKLGFHVMKSLVQGFSGTIVPINPGAETVMDLPAVPDLGSCASPIDLLIIVVPAGRVLEILQDAVRLEVGGVVLITAGFREIDDPAGEALQRAIQDLALQSGLPVIGPNTFGLVNLQARLNSSFTPEFLQIKPGAIGLISQSGGIAHQLAFLAERQGIGLSKIVGLGNRLTIDFAEMLAFLAEDAATRVIAMYIEGLDNPRPLMERARLVFGQKAMLAYKAGDRGHGDQVSRSHTGSLAGNKAVYQGAFKQAGIYPVQSSQDLLDFSWALTCCPLPCGPRVAVLSGQAGPNMTACDVLLAEGLELACFSPATTQRIQELLPPLAMRENPVDMGPAWYSILAVQGIVQAVLDDDQVDMVLVLTMYASANREVLPGLTDFFLGWAQKKPLISCFLAPKGIWDQALETLQEHKAICNLDTPEQAARVAAFLWRYQQFTKREVSL